jgi:argininosuccinate synthase
MRTFGNKMKKNKFGIDENILRQAEEDSELLDSLNEISEKQMHHTYRDDKMAENRNPGLIDGLLEEGND